MLHHVAHRAGDFHDSRSRWRARLPAPPAKNGEAETESASAWPPDPESRPEPAADQTRAASALPDASARPRRRPLPWAQLLMRVFFIDVLRCPRCAASMVVLALISDPQVLRKILEHLGLPTEVPAVAPAVPSYPEEPLFEDGAASAAPARSPPRNTAGQVGRA